MIAKIEKVAAGAPVSQPSSLYVSVAKPLEVWIAPDLYQCSPPTVFYKAPQTQPYYSVFPNFADNKANEEEEARATLKAEPRIVPLLEKAGIKLREDRRLPPPPGICEDWWSQSEKIIKDGEVSRSKRGLGYNVDDSSDSEEQEINGPNWWPSCNTTHVIRDWQHELWGDSSDEEDLECLYNFPFQTYPFCAATNDMQGLRDEQDILSMMNAAMAAPHGEVLNAAPAPEQLEDDIHHTTDDLIEINLGSDDDPHPTFVSATLTPEEHEDYRKFLMQYRDCFACSYQEMPGLDPKVATHKLAIDPQYRPIKQQPRRFRPELQNDIVAEVDKLINVGFIKEIQYPRWLANIVPVLKKNGLVRVCVDFHDLNRTCPKDDFPTPRTEMVIDATTGYGALSFMDGFSGYNQIKMDENDARDTAFQTPRGNYYYTVMPFGLKNAGATYQRAMTIVFDELIHQSVECYIDDLVVKTREREHHQNDLREVFERLRKYQLKMNPLKCAFAVQSGVFLGFIVRRRGIEIQPKSIKAILKMPPPHNLEKLRSLQGKLAYI